MGNETNKLPALFTILDSRVAFQLFKNLFSPMACFLACYANADLERKWSYLLPRAGSAEGCRAITPPGRAQVLGWVSTVAAILLLP